MKALALAAIMVVVCVVLFVAGVFSPGASRRMEKPVERLARKGERKTDKKQSMFAEATHSSLKFMRRAAEKSAEAGRGVHDRFVR